MLRISARILADTAIPVASSAALLMRLPDDNLSIARSRSDRLRAKMREADIDGTFVFATTPVAM
jgi:hypothetical protein